MLPEIKAYKEDCALVSSGNQNSKNRMEAEKPPNSVPSVQTMESAPERKSPEIVPWYATGRLFFWPAIACGVIIGLLIFCVLLISITTDHVNDGSSVSSFAGIPLSSPIVRIKNSTFDMRKNWTKIGILAGWWSHALSDWLVVTVFSVLALALVFLMVTATTTAFIHLVRPSYTTMNTYVTTIIRRQLLFTIPATCLLCTVPHLDMTCRVLKGVLYGDACPATFWAVWGYSTGVYLLAPFLMAFMPLLAGIMIGPLSFGFFYVCVVCVHISVLMVWGELRACLGFVDEGNTEENNICGRMEGVTCRYFS